MATTFKNGVSLHQLMERAPLDALSAFVVQVEEGNVAAAFAEVPWADATDEEKAGQVRHQILGIADSLPPEFAVPLNAHAQRILTLADGRGHEAIMRILQQLSDPTHVTAIESQLDAIGRSLWLYQHLRPRFEDAEALFYADHYRNHGRMYEAFEFDAGDDAVFVWNDDLKTELESLIQKKLELSGRCSVTHLEVCASSGTGKERIQHMLIVRHGGPLSSVAAYEEKDGSRKVNYYRPLNEATLLYSPSDGEVEVFSASAAMRQQVAACFAEAGLKLTLSGRPLTLKQYNLSRFLDSLALNIPVVEGFDIIRAVVVEIDARPDNPKHKLGLKVSVHDDIEAVANKLLGADHLFKRAVSIAKLVIAVRYSQHGTVGEKTLNITLSQPNRCNLRSNNDPVQRELGYALLRQWGVLNQVEPLTLQQERKLFPALLQLFDQTSGEVSGQYFQLRGLDPQALKLGGFIEHRGRYGHLLLDEDDVHHEVTVDSAGKAGWVRYQHPVSGLMVEVPAMVTDKFAIKRDWLDEIVHKRLQGHLENVRMIGLDEHLTLIGDIRLGGELLPCYLARDLRTPATLQRLDILLRARHSMGTGLILSSGRDNPLCLGPNVVVSVADYLVEDVEGQVVDVTRLGTAFVAGKTLASGGTFVALNRSGRYSATLVIPGKDPLTLAGPKHIDFFQKLVDAYYAGAPAVPTKQLMDAAGSQATSPSQLFGKLWETIEGVYVGFPIGVKRGSYQLLT